MQNFQNLMNKRVLLTKKNGAQSIARLIGIRIATQEVCLGNVAMVMPNGGFVCRKTANARWFPISSFVSIDVE